MIKMVRYRICQLLLLASLLAGCAGRTPPGGGEEPIPPVVDMHTSRISLDWSGVYAGLLPSPCGQGQATEVVLADDYTYQLRQALPGEALGGAAAVSGHFQWDAEGSSITLLDTEGNPLRLLVGEGILLPLDAQGARLAGERADRFNLLKQ